MLSAAPKIVALQADSMWAVVVVVSLVTLPLVLGLRRLINQPGGVVSGMLLSLPLALPLAVAAAMSKPVLPEIGWLHPATQTFLNGHGGGLKNLFLLGSADHSVSLYTLNGTPGLLILILGASVSTVMLLRRLVGAVVMRRLTRRSVGLTEDDRPGVSGMVRTLAATAGLKQIPQVMVLPPGSQGAFAMGGRRGRILLSRDLLACLEDDELEAMLAHEIAHLEAFDVPVVFLAGLMRDLVAWNPVAHVAFRKLALDRELEADRRAASMTGRPLAVASSLIKMCELMTGQGRAAPGTSLGFLVARTRVQRRVGRLLALADGRVQPAPAGTRLPFLVAALLAAGLALQVGSVMTRTTPAALAFVWGTPSVPAGQIITDNHFAGPANGQARAHRDKHDGTVATAIATGQSDFPPKSARVGWKLVMSARQAVSPQLIRTIRPTGTPQPRLPRAVVEQRRGWQAAPILPESSLGVGVYRVIPQDVVTKTVVRP